MKKILFLICELFAVTAYATTPDSHSVTTSQKYVEEGLSNRQDTIPTKSGAVAIAPTSTKGTLAERQVKTTLGNETTNQSDTGITTVATVNTARDNKQAKLPAYPANVNIVTYTGTTSNTTTHTGPGITVPTPVYDEIKNTYGNGLVRAETLNTAVQRGVSRALTPVAAGFQINDIGNVLPVTIYALATDTPTEGCWKRINTDSNHQNEKNICSTALYNDMVRGDWGVVMPKPTGITYSGTCEGTVCGKEIRGISACIDTSGTQYVIAPDSLSATLQTAYENSRDGTRPSGKYCYCKVVEPHAGVTIAVSPWVLYYATHSYAECEYSCAFYCAAGVLHYSQLRGALFGGVNVN